MLRPAGTEDPAEPTARSASSYLSLLRDNRNFRRLFGAQLISLGGDWFNLVALTGLLLHLTGSGFYAGAVLAASFIPQFLAAPLAGVIADRFDRRRLMLAANLAGAVLALSMLAVHSAATAWLGLAAMAGIAATGALFDPASRAGLPNVVRPQELGPANVLMASTWGIMVAVGAAVGGLVAATLGRDVAFVINSGSFLVSAGLILGVRGTLGPLRHEQAIPAALHPARAALHPASDLAAGIAYCRTEPRVLALLTQKIGFGLGTGMIGLLPIFATRVYGASDTGIGILYAARGLGTLLGPYGARAFIGGSQRRLFLAISAAMGLFGAAYLLFPAAPGLWVGAGVVVVAHLGGGTQNTMTSYGLQELTPDPLRGRILAFELSLITLTMSISLLVATWAAESFALGSVIRVLAVITIAYAGIWAAATYRFWRRSGALVGADAPVAAGRQAPWPNPQQ